MTTHRPPPRRPLPEPSELTKPYWDAAAQGRLVVQYCETCSLYLHPPRPACPRCLDGRLTFREVSGRGQVHAATTVTEPRVEGFEDYVPYSCIAVQLEEQEDLLLLTNYVDGAGAAHEPGVGTAVEVTFETIGPGVALPQFRASGTGGSTAGV